VIACAGGANINEYMMPLKVTPSGAIFISERNITDPEMKAVFLSRRLSSISEHV
jgi:hypothetical protein